MPEGALSGLRVLDLAQGSFALAGRLLAGLGAEVIKVEPPGGDPLRRMPPFPGDAPDLETGARHLHLDAGKESVVLDLDADEGRDALLGLVAGCDALIESFPPGHLAARGLGFEDLRAIRPDLVMASVTHFGQDGPYARYHGSEIVDVALGGYLKLTGDPDREPVKPYDDLTTMHAALHAAAAVAIGLLDRDATGEGDWFDVATVDAALFLLGGVAQIHHFDGVIPPRQGARLLFSNPRYPYPSTIRPCLDGYVHAHSNNRDASLLAALMPGLGLEPLLDTPMGNADAIDERMDRWLATRSKFEVVRLAQELRLPFTEVLAPDEILADPHLRERGFMVELPHPVAPPVPQPGAPAILSATPWRHARAPLLGEHTAPVLAGASRPAPPLSPAHPPARPRRPLTGIRVIELTTAVAGPIAGCVFADMGAEVIKIEGPRARTAAQSAAPPAVPGAPDLPYNRTPFWNELHRGKRHVSIDLATPAGRGLALALVAQADVVIENFSPGVLGRLGLDYPALAAVKPDIILASMPAFGSTGPYAHRGSYGPGVDAMSGLSHLTGYPDRGPGKPAQFYLDQSSGLMAALTVVAALRHRRRTGEGQRIELAMLENELQLVAPALAEVAMNGRVPSRIGNRHAWLAPQGVYPCGGEDRWVAIACESDAQWRALAGAIGCAERVDEPRFATAEGRRAAHDEIDALIAAWTAGRSAREAMEALQAAGVPAGAVLDVAEVHADPHLRHRGSLAWVEHPEMGRFPHTRTAWRSRRGHDGVVGPAPRFAEHTREVLALAGAGGADDVERLVADGVIALAPLG